MTRRVAVIFWLDFALLARYVVVVNVYNSLYCYLLIDIAMPPSAFMGIKQRSSDGVGKSLLVHVDTSRTPEVFI